MLFAPSISQPTASATENNSSTSTSTTENGSDISTYAVTPTVGISLPASIDFADVLPTPSGATTTATADLTITTSDSAGYSLYLYSSDGDNSLRPKISANISTINATAGDVGLTLSSLEPNTWGYNLGTSAPTDTTTYSAVPTDNSTPIQTKDTSDTNFANDTYTLSFGAKVDTTTASGAYSNTLTIAVVAEPRQLTWDELVYMQDMNPSACSNAVGGSTKRLTDARDQKQYWVTKLADGNCWMTQNLDLDLSTSKALTPDDSDVSRSWTPTNDTLTDGTKTTIDNTAVWSWNLGDYVLTTPNAGNSCGTSGISDFGDCTSVGFQSVAGMTPMADGNVTDVISGNTYNAHYHVGNHYTWNAATAGTGGTITSAEATDSICPKGWRLPTSTRSGEYQALMNAYSISSNDAGSTALVFAPLYFVRSGYVSSGSLLFAGNESDYWSSTAYSDTSDAYFLYFTLGYVRPSGYDTRYNGQSVRCLASQ